MTNEFRALLVHLFTATGAVFAMLAMLAAVDGKWSTMFVWLVIAFVVDGIDPEDGSYEWLFLDEIIVS